jgi:hypothetical protein
MSAAHADAAGGHTYVVRSTGNGGDVNIGDHVCDAAPSLEARRCTLRAAIEEANADIAEDRIEFRIGGRNATGVQIIAVPSPGLPRITEPLVIDGYTQPDARPNTAAKGTNARLRIVLDGPGPSASFPGLAVDPSARPTVVVRGLNIRHFEYGIELYGSHSVVAGNFIGTDVSGTAARPNRLGLTADLDDHMRIGGSSRADRNLISGNLDDGIFASGADSLRIRGNLIGVKASGTGDLGNGDRGIDMSAAVAGSAGVVIGGDTAAKANVIAHSGRDGIVITGVGQSVRVLRNSIFANGDLAIDMGDDGVSGSDGDPDADSDPNGLQNPPDITSARNVDGTTRIRGTLLTAPFKTYRLEFFANPAGTDEARRYIGAKTVTTDIVGYVSWRFRPANRVPAGQTITATATDLAAGQTSEVSTPRTVVRP